MTDDLLASLGTALNETPAPNNAELAAQAAALLERVRELAPTHDPMERGRLLLAAAHNFLQIEAGVEAWKYAREAFDLFMTQEHWEGAVDCCNVMYLTEQPDSLPALGQGAWLAVTYPINPELSVVILEHIIDDTPDNSDGAAVAAAAAHYLAELRAGDQARDNLVFFTGQLLAKVARRHSKATDQARFDAWVNKLELNDPALFLPRLRNVIDVMVQDHWWFDRDALRARLPVN